MTSHAVPVPRGRRQIPVAPLLARLRRWWIPTDSRIAWTIGPDGMPSALLIAPEHPTLELR
ncbi:MAG: hypothetical protein ACT4QG_00810 [Sporichthyaceae bacterium]